MSDLSRWPDAEALLDRLLDLPVDRRRAFLDAEVADAELRAALETILREDEDTGFLDPAGAIARPVFRDLEGSIDGEPHPERAGPYRLLEEIGRGGMARVFLAERSEGGFDQRVALKLVRAGGDGGDLGRRFELERQILAQLQHPAIARLLDGGETVDGQPWFAMELVDGRPIESFCRERGLELGARIRLFLDVCEAVAYAHRNLVVHRDLKSSNVLVSESGEVKLLDFGIAKLVTPSAAQTATQHRLLTPEFASPEQITGEPVTTASDVYQLGHLLYRLVTGRSPYRERTTTPALLHEAILTDTPAAPSAAVLDDSAGGIGDARRCARALRGDLDAIVMKALRKEPERRYPTVRALIDDLEAYLDERPVTARPDSLGYRFRRFAARHRAPVTVAAVALLTLTMATVAFVLRVASERDRALQEASRANAIAGFLTDVFRVADPNVARGNSVTARELLDRAAEEIETTLRGQPEVRAALLETMGLAYRELGLYQPAEELLAEALDQRLATTGAGHPDTLHAMESLGTVYWRQGRFDEAAETHQRAFEGAKSTLGPEHPQTLTHANQLGLAWWRQGRYQEAADLFRTTLEAMERVHGAEHADTASVRNNLAGVYWTQGRYEGAAELYRVALAVNRRLLGEDSHLTLNSLYNLALSLKAQGLLQEAAPLFVDAVERRRRVFGEEHSSTLGSVSGLASLYAETGRLEEAERLHRELLETRLRVLGADHIQTLGSMHNLASANWLLADHEEAERLYRETLERRVESLGAEHPETLFTSH
ncbi:MAG TPA: serine/threonine-protein kinase, partial [Thermoanaerobaculia bacterium]|nr:serine/threonine-protein kinase [Thermoanaerobaculia bacterium]